MVYNFIFLLLNTRLISLLPQSSAQRKDQLPRQARELGRQLLEVPSS